MGLRKAQIANFTNIYGMTDDLMTLKVKSVSFYYEDLQVEVVFRAVPANWQQGMREHFPKMTFPIDLGDTEIVDLITGNSDKLWEIIPDIPFLEVFENELIVKKSLNELNAEVVDA